MRVRRVVLLAGVTALVVARGDGQNKAARLTFEVAPVKPAQAGGGEGVIRPMPAGQGYQARGASVKLMMSIMYGIPLWRIAGGDRMEADRYDIEAKADRSYSLDGAKISMRDLCWWLTQVLQRDERQVIDRTGLDKNYDFRAGVCARVPAGLSERADTCGDSRASLAI